MNKPNSKTFDFSRPETVESNSQLSESVDRDFGSATDVLADGVSRRRWLQLMGASLALGGAAGCRYQEETIAPFAFRPQNRVPGVPQKFATMLNFDGFAQPVLATCYDGRPIKLDGNPDHEYTGIASTSFTQARILELYDPDRLRRPIKFGEAGMSAKDVSHVDATRVEVNKALEFLQAGSLAGVAVLSGPVCSPTVNRLKKNIESKGGMWFTFASLSDDNSRAGAKAAFGKMLRPHYLFDKAEVIVSIDADPLQMDGAAIANNRRFAKGRDVDHAETMSRMYVVESQYSTTGGAADHRMSMRSSEIGRFVAALVDAVEANKPVADDLPYREKVLAAMASDLNKAKNGKGIVVCGERQPPEVHAAVHKLNESLGNNGESILFTEPLDAERPLMLDAIKDFAAKADSGAIQSLVVIEGNPVYDAPRELNIAEAIGKVGNSVHLTLAKNETSLVCKTVTDIAHGLESWGDGCAYDGSVCISQPLVSPLFGSPSVIELLGGIAGQEVELTELEEKRELIPVPGAGLVQETHGLSEERWNESVQAGFISDSGSAMVDARCGDVAKLDGAADWNKPWDGDSLEVVFAPSSSVYDGRFANNAWLQELPDFFTKVTWDNVAVMSPETAEKLGVHGQTKVVLQIGDRSMELPACIIPGTAAGSVGVALGYGRTVAGRVGGNAEGADTIGSDAGAIRSAADWYVSSTASMIGSGTRYRLATIQEPWNFDEVGTAEIEKRMFRNPNKSESDRSSMIREGTFESYQAYLAKHGGHSHDEHGADHEEGDHSHDAGEHAADGHSSKTNSKLESMKRRGFDPADGSLPVLNNVALVSPLSPAANSASEEVHEDGGHAHHWPEAFHMHHELFDITPGSRETYRRDKTTGHAWGMSIDLNKCTGCNACVIACQAENNIPVVGKSQVMVGREMHWMRIDRYFGKNLYNDKAAESDDQQVAIQPMTCHHCENAPCETVCPVAATVHSSEGLNDMVYNRCIGTRYCGNNCPYKVRRFNYFNYSDAVTLIKYPGADKLPKGDRALQNLMMNPEVTVRSRGVMEKCTYCVQRIQNTKIQAKVEGNREVGANEITTACQDVCPTQAIKFGDLNNPENEAAKAQDGHRAYVLLEELNNIPRTKYLARVRNPHVKLVDHDDRDSVRGGRDHATADVAAAGSEE